MKLLFDQNLSRFLPMRMADALPDCSHVIPLGMSSATDEKIAEFAVKHGFVVVTKDVGFAENARRSGKSAKVVVLRIGNRSTVEIELLLRANLAGLRRFAEADDRLEFELKG